MQIGELISGISLFIGKEVYHEPLNGGYSNQTYKIICDGKHYVLRIFGSQVNFLHFDRKSEIQAMQLLNKHIHSPVIFYSDPNEKYVLLEYIEGRSLSKEDLEGITISQRIVSQLKKIHDSVEVLQSVSRQCSPYHLVNSYLSGADQLHVKQPEGLAPFLHKMEKIAYQRSFDKQYNHKFCHNDYYLFNLIWSPQNKKLHVLDWELCGIGDVFFDLASIPFTNRFNSEQEKLWLRSYFGYYEDEQYAILQDMKFMNMLRECTWGLLHSGLAQEKVNHSLDYYKHAEHVIERLQQGFNYF